MLPRVSRSSLSAHAVVFSHRAASVSKRSVIAADLRARDLERIVFIEEHTVGVVGYIHFHADGTVELAKRRRRCFWSQVHRTGGGPFRVRGCGLYDQRTLASCAASINRRMQSAVPLRIKIPSSDNIFGPF